VQAGPDETTVTLRRDGRVWVGEHHRPMRVSKTFHFRRGSDSYTCTYTVRNLSGAPVDVRFGVELAAGFDGGQVLDLCHMTINGEPDKLALAEHLEHHGVRQHTTISTIRGIALSTRLDQPCTLWSFPLETVTQSEAGYERGYQGTVYLHIWPVHLEPDAEWQTTLSQQVDAYN